MGRCIAFQIPHVSWPGLHALALSRVVCHGRTPMAAFPCTHSSLLTAVLLDTPSLPQRRTLDSQTPLISPRMVHLLCRQSPAQPFHRTSARFLLVDQKVSRTTLSQSNMPISTATEQERRPSAAKDPSDDHTGGKACRAASTEYPAVPLGFVVKLMMSGACRM